jgi:transposase
VITGVERRRRYAIEDKLRLVEEAQRPGMSVSLVARRHGVHWTRPGFVDG